MIDFHGNKPIENWDVRVFIDQCLAWIKETVGDSRVILGLSGGVDSSVAAALIYEAIGSRLIPIFVDNGVMRYKEAERVREMFAGYPELNINFVDATGLFLGRLAGVSDPEAKRKIIGTSFIEVFDSEAKKHDDAAFLAQGTLYPDVAESISEDGKTLSVKSHHNVGGLPEKMNLKLLEPFRRLYKYQVREIGRELGMSPRLVDRHPFPGPGLAVRILGAVDKNQVKILQEADEIFIDELYKWDLYKETWQAFAVLLPLQSVGVEDSKRTYKQVCALRAVNSSDGMVAKVTQLPLDFLLHVSQRISNEVSGISRVVFDISSKPPATIEWE